MEKPRQLREARNSTEAINIAYQALNATKTGKEVISMSAICSKAGIPSRGYLSLVVNGRRILHRKYGDALARALNLKGIEKDLFLALLDSDHATDSVKRRQLKSAIVRYRKMLLLDESIILPSRLGSEAIVGDVLCSFSLFPEGAEEGQILSLFPLRRHSEVKAAIKNLRKEGYLKKDGAKLLQKRKGTIFIGSKDRLAPARYVNSSFNELAQLALDLNEHIDQCYLAALTVSVKKADYQKFLNDFKTKVMELIAGVDHDSGDQIIRVNVGVYPVVPALGIEGA